MRYLSATHPSSTSIYSYAIGADDDLEQAMADLADLNVLRLAAVAALSDAYLKKVPVVHGQDGRMMGIVSRSAINRLAIASYLSNRGELLQTAVTTTV